MRTVYLKTPPGWETLLNLAAEAKKKAYAPYSGFSVGAALMTEDRLFSGCNVENASFSLTICAERVAIGNMVTAAGNGNFCMAIIADSAEPSPPCGACLQVMSEMGCQQVLAANRDLTKFEEIDFNDLIPYRFSKDNLKM